MKQPPKAPAAAGRAVQAPEPPRSIALAVRLMYVGAGLTLLGMAVIVGLIAAIGTSIHSNHPGATVAQVHATQGALIIYTLAVGLIEAAIWIVVARLNRSGLKWARIAATVLFGLNTVYLLDLLIGHIVIVNVLNVLLRGLAGLGAVYYLWQQDASAYIAERSATSAAGSRR